MTQTSLSFTLVDRAHAWADANEGGTFADLCDAMGADATSVDVAARGVLRWRDGGYQVGRPGAGEE